MMKVRDTIKELRQEVSDMSEELEGTILEPYLERMRKVLDSFLVEREGAAVVTPPPAAITRRPYSRQTGRLSVDTAIKEILERSGQPMTSDEITDQLVAMNIQYGGSKPLRQYVGERLAPTGAVMKRYPEIKRVKDRPITFQWLP